MKTPPTFPSCAGGVRDRRRDEVYPILGLSASVLVGMHSLIDFSMQIPAIALTYSALLGMGVAQIWSSREPVSGENGFTEDFRP